MPPLEESINQTRKNFASIEERDGNHIEYEKEHIHNLGEMKKGKILLGKNPMLDGKISSYK